MVFAEEEKSWSFGCTYNLEHFHHQRSVCDSANICDSHIQVLLTNFFPTSPIKLKLRLKQVGGTLLIATTHLDQSNYLPNQKQRAINKFDLIVLIRLFAEVL
jgi:hypothetical protein